MVILVKYTCDDCGVSGAEVRVRARRASEDIVNFIETAVSPAITADHRRRSPLCDAGVITKIAIPMPPGGRPGDPMMH